MIDNQEDDLMCVKKQTKKKAVKAAEYVGNADAGIINIYIDFLPGVNWI